jgi:hypothetical protein
MKTRPLIGLITILLTLAVIVPLIFFLSRGVIPANQFLLIALGILALLLWVIPFVTLVDPLLRRGVGSILNLNIVWRGRGAGRAASWTAMEKSGCLTGIALEALGYFFLLIWYLPWLGVIGIVWWIWR